MPRSTPDPVSTCLRWWVALLLCLVVAPSRVAAEPDPRESVPEALRPWIPWVLADYPDVVCPATSSGERICVWPGRLALDLDESGGSFALDLELASPHSVTLPGDSTHWPGDVMLDGAPATLARVGDIPTAAVPAGRHRLTGRFAWPRLPESLPVPPAVALLDLRVRGEAVRDPRREEAGLVWLQAADRGEQEQDRLTIDVHRKLTDDLPTLLETRLRLRVAGAAREIDLGAALPEGFEAVQLTSDLPARLSRTGSLRLQLRPGDWSVQLIARALTSVTSVGPNPGPEPWPGSETWVVEANPDVRSARVEGGAGVDPNRTSLPSEWRSLPAYLVDRGDRLTLVELKRGTADAAPGSMTLRRDVWFDADGSGLTVRDRGSVESPPSGRLDARAPTRREGFTLGRVELNDTASLITEGSGGAPGVEIRRDSAELFAVLRYARTGFVTALPSVGWNLDAQSLNLEVHLPPGWRMLHASGADSVSGTWIRRWELLDLFALLLIALSFRMLAGNGAGLLAALTLALVWPESGAPRWLWLAALAPVALASARNTRARRVATASFHVVFWPLVLVGLLFAREQLRVALHPELDGGSAAGLGNMLGDLLGGTPTGVTPDALRPLSIEPSEGFAGGGDGPARLEAALDDRARLREERSAAKSTTSSLGGDDYLDSRGPRAARYDNAQVVQTGPGVPNWDSVAVSLGWQGPVTAEGEVRFWVLPPVANSVLGFVRVALLLGLIAMLWRTRARRAMPTPGDDRRAPGPAAPGPGAAPTAAVVALLIAGVVAVLPRDAAAQMPDEGRLNELRNRLTRLPDCHPNCVEAARIDLTARESSLQLDLELHALADGPAVLPGPDSAWSPTSVSVDGEASVRLQRRNDGHLELWLSPGVHRVRLIGPSRDNLPLQMPLVPRQLRFSGDGWLLDGYRPDAPVPSSVRLMRNRALVPNEGSAEADDDVKVQAELAPWLAVERELDLGVPWMVHGRITRLGPADEALLLRVALLPGESVTTPGLAVEEGRIVVPLQRGETEFRWNSTLAEAGSLTLVAPTAEPWNERWVLNCSPVWRCEPSGLTPASHGSAGDIKPVFKPQPGESLRLSLSRPAATAGASTTVDSALIEVSRGNDLREVTLSYFVRSSQGGEQRVTLPDAAEVLSFTVDAQPRPVQTAGNVRVFSIEPGSHTVAVRWREALPPAVVESLPRFDLGHPVTNVTWHLTGGDNRWLLWTLGPSSWGPVVTLWQYVFALLLTAFVLARYAPTPLSMLSWFALGLGMTQTDFLAPLIIAIWLVALGLRGRMPAVARRTRNFVQVMLAGLTGLAALSVIYAVASGLSLSAPNTYVEGPGSGPGILRWFVDRSGSSPSEPSVIWLPVWVWRALMMLWALWLAAQVLRWIRWGREQAGAGGWWAPRVAAAKQTDAAVPPTTEPSAPPGAAPEEAPRDGQ